MLNMHVSIYFITIILSNNQMYVMLFGLILNNKSSLESIEDIHDDAFITLTVK